MMMGGWLALDALLLGAAVLCLFVWRRGPFRSREVEEVGSKLVVVSGCDSGFGRLLSHALASKGFRVVAACRDKASCAAVETESENCKGRVHAVKVDVCVQEDVDALRTFVDNLKSEAQLWAVVNNAGMGCGTLVDLTPVSTYQTVMDVNLFGTLRVSKAFIGSLRRAGGGRIVNVSSIAGRVAGISGSSYSCSKFAIEALSDAMRNELYQFGIKVSVVNPSAHKTPITSVDKLERDTDAAWSSNSPEKLATYGRTYFDSVVDLQRDMYKRDLPSPMDVVDALTHAVCAKYPKSRYIVGTDAWLLEVFLRWSPCWFADAMQRMFTKHTLKHLP